MELIFLNKVSHYVNALMFVFEITFPCEYLKFFHKNDTKVFYYFRLFKDKYNGKKEQLRRIEFSI